MDPISSYLLPLSVGMLRFMGIFLFLPFFGIGNLGNVLTRTAICFVFSIPLLPRLSAISSFIPLENFSLIFLCIRELSIGILIGIISALPFWAIESGGAMIDMMSGTEIASVFDPTLGTQSGHMGNLFSRILTLLFFTSGAWQILTRAVYQSYVDLPPDQYLNFSKDAYKFILIASRAILDMGLQFVLPILIVMFIIDLLFGMLNRAVRQLDVFFLAMPVKNMAGIFLLIVSINYSINPYLNYFQHLHIFIAQLVGKYR
ncbi:type III secretion system export apparatus subunit SctT [Paraburkholderia sediminicola]|uniref:type III secretion system export apparatus subunit SctT n=1 Tax=Paraburkholderia sediminicola TaxID=458836 RepID=UPI0038BB4334